MLLAFVSIAQSPGDIDQRLSEYLEIQHRRMGFAGIVMIASSDGQVVEKKVGLASIELDVPIRANTKFKIASMTKSFTAFLVTLSEHEGKFS